MLKQLNKFVYSIFGLMDKYFNMIVLGIRMKKPQPKTEVKIVNYNEQDRTIAFYATIESKKDFYEFGVIETVPRNGVIVLTLDERYDFNEVLEYMKNYNAICEVLSCNQIAGNKYVHGLRVCRKHAK